MKATWIAMPRLAQRLIVLWCALLVAFGVGGALLLSSHQARAAIVAAQRHQARMNGEASKTEPARTPPPGHQADVPVKVKAGIYVDRVAAIHLAESQWEVDFLVWFTWTGDATPGETFTVVDGEVSEKHLLYKRDDGDTHYERYRVTATITKHFNAARFPMDAHLLTIALEDQARQSYQLEFVPDEAGSKISSRVEITGYRITGSQIAVRPHGYQSPMGDPALPADYRATFSQLIFGISIKRPSWDLFAKLFLALYISVFITLLGLLLRSASERLAIAGTALFIEIVNAEVVAPMMPETGHITLADLVGSVGYLTTGLVFIQGVIAHRYLSNLDDPSTKATAHFFDIITLWFLGGAFVVINVAAFMR